MRKWRVIYAKTLPQQCVFQAYSMNAQCNLQLATYTKPQVMLVATQFIYILPVFIIT